MNTDQAYNRIDKYIAGTSTRPILVDAPDETVYHDILKHYQVGNVAVITATNFCEKDHIPQWEKIVNNIRTRDNNSIIVGLDTFLKLEGRQNLKKRMRELLDIHGRSKTVVLTLGCRQLLDYSDPRIKSSGKLTLLDGEIRPVKTLCFVKPGLIEPDKFIDGLSDLPKLVRFNQEEVVIITTHKASEFPESLYDIRDYDSSYRILSADNPDLNSISESFGTEAEWEFLHKLVEKFGSVEKTMIAWGGRNGLAQFFTQFEELDEFGKWHYLLGLKLYGTQANKYLSNAARKADSVPDFIRHICEDILGVNPKSSTFQIMYDERKSLMRHLGDFPDAIDRACKLCLGLKSAGLYYLTDTTIKEKETIISLLVSYGNELGKKKVLSLLQKIYPALNAYLNGYSYGNPLLDKYFNTYKFDKVTNVISDTMREMVEEQAVKREYNSLLQPRSLVVDNLDKEGSILYFIDALGAEYLAYLQSRFFENGFDFKATVARCELPSITSQNKEFVEMFEGCGCKIVSRKELDNLKHEGGESYDYQNNKLPIHIVKELEILDQLVEHLKSTLAKGTRAFIIGDHGSSRLAVINESEIKWEVSEKGKHSGRCCLKSDVDEKPESATESNDFWCLANYDRFKGGRKAMIEVHGGATLEEVCVPIIEVSKQDKTISCEVRNDGPALRGIKTTPILKLFVEKETPAVSIEMEGRFYESMGCQVPYVHEFELSGIKRPGTYTFNVYLEGILIARNLEIEVANQGAKERKLF